MDELTALHEALRSDKLRKRRVRVSDTLLDRARVARAASIRRRALLTGRSFFVIQTGCSQRAFVESAIENLRANARRRDQSVRFHGQR